MLDLVATRGREPLLSLQLQLEKRLVVLPGLAPGSLRRERRRLATTPQYLHV
jgi:hypothetical protein